MAERFSTRPPAHRRLAVRRGQAALGQRAAHSRAGRLGVCAASLPSSARRSLPEVAVEAARTGGATLVECAQLARELVDPPEPDDEALELADDARGRGSAGDCCSRFRRRRRQTLRACRGGLRRAEGGDPRSGGQARAVAARTAIAAHRSRRTVRSFRSCSRRSRPSESRRLALQPA